ncbi:hypothetical protein [Acidipila sp. EB88]|uniref:hypothetical protein n=1 Tax=Acidipila sp. EB88 TaxID=2305226 RepID=UPI000F5E9B35|nr:hypothetical protein [Acidipila sp. EB88]RRA47727.1 hypothetical protein D1Y84_04870 [Acidipila sp. EB88]
MITFAVDIATHGSTPVEHTSDLAAVLSAVASICSAVVWPVLIGLVLWWFRDQARELLRAAVGVAEGATRFKIWQIEFDRDVQQQVAQSESAALQAPVSTSPLAGHAIVADPGQPAAGDTAARATERAAMIPSSEVAAATGVRSLLDAAPNSTLRKTAESAIKQRMLGFAQEYETLRASMHAGPERTRAMNAVMAKMRTLALAADLFLEEWMGAISSPGRRLAAIAILQMKPQMAAVPWLVERMRLEQPFVFFHASVALLNAARRFGGTDRATLAEAVRASLARVQSFGENADPNTVRLLTLAQSELETPA